MNTLIILCMCLPLICGQAENDLDRVIFPEDSSGMSVAPLLMQVNEVSNPIKTPIQRSSEKFSLDLFFTIANSIQPKDVNFVISPFSIWSMLILVAEGASQESFAQLARALNLPEDMNHLRPPFQNLERLLFVNTTSVEVTVNQALFSDLKRPLEDNYVHLVRSVYEADQVAVNFDNQFGAAQTINDHIAFRTHGKIHDVVLPGDLIDAHLVLASSIYFNGAWKFPFDVHSTSKQPFYRENGEILHAEVPFMSQVNSFSYATIGSLRATFIELPYGEDARFSMILIRPKSTLADVFQKLRQFDIAKIHAKMHRNDNELADAGGYRLTLPRFSIDSNLELRSILQRLGIFDVFDTTRANLSKMSKTPVNVSRVNHKAVIKVDERGTIAAAATTVQFHFYSLTDEILIDRPFGFLITDRITHTLLFAGQVRNPLA